MSATELISILEKLRRTALNNACDPKLHSIVADMVQALNFANDANVRVDTIDSEIDREYLLRLVRRRWESSQNAKNFWSVGWTESIESVEQTQPDSKFRGVGVMIGSEYLFWLFWDSVDKLSVAIQIGALADCAATGKVSTP